MASSSEEGESVIWEAERRLLRYSEAFHAAKGGQDCEGSGVGRGADLGNGSMRARERRKGGSWNVSQLEVRKEQR